MKIVFVADKGATCKMCEYWLTECSTRQSKMCFDSNGNRVGYWRKEKKIITVNYRDGTELTLEEI